MPNEASLVVAASSDDAVHEEGGVESHAGGRVSGDGCAEVHAASPSIVVSDGGEGDDSGAAGSSSSMRPPLAPLSRSGDSRGAADSLCVAAAPVLARDSGVHHSASSTAAGGRSLVVASGGETAVASQVLLPRLEAALASLQSRACSVTPHALVAQLGRLTQFEEFQAISIASELVVRTGSETSSQMRGTERESAGILRAVIEAESAVADEFIRSSRPVSRSGTRSGSGTPTIDVDASRSAAVSSTSSSGLSIPPGLRHRSDGGASASANPPSAQGSEGGASSGSGSMDSSSASSGFRGRSTRSATPTSLRQ